ncbi:MBL fold metallo-hydrolase [Syntrophomonas palmitatica]|uniref:MBL fold metallo-hydrolase n=1 Tax=Syntrophomonas palmitatica TaxID=402877 RepID=UPI0006D23041|nr:MBL fold metallo-hydrolase [Syntrophomonas palmitatica]
MQISCVVERLTDTNGYIVSDPSTRRMIIIDPCNSSLIEPYIFSGHLHNEFIILTHEHYDHIAGLNELRELSHCPVIAHKKCSESIQSPIHNMARYYHILLTLRKQKTESEQFAIPNINRNYRCQKADIEFMDYYNFSWHGHSILIQKTPGHSEGSCCILIDNKYLFTGDTLLNDYEVIFRFPGGSEEAYYKRTIPFFETLSADTIVFPGHGRTFLLRDALR